MKLIWAEDLNGGIGADNALLWHIPQDLRRFKELTVDSTVVMGYNTWMSLPFRPLPKRDNVVLSRAKALEDVPGAFQVMSSVEDTLKLFPDAWVIGGSTVYQEFLPHAEEIHRTVVGRVYSEADSFAPKGWESQFLLEYAEVKVLDDGTELNFETWVRILR